MNTGQENDLQSSRAEKRLLQMKIKRRNRIIGNIMIYTGIGILILVCVAVIFMLFKRQAGQEITSLRLEEVSVNIRSGNSLQLHPITEPKGVEYALSYKSSDESVVSVSGKGVISALKVGTTTITVSSGDKTDKCIVTVRPDTIDTLIAKTDSITLGGGETVLMPVEYSPAKAKEKDIVFESNNPEIASVDSEGNIKGIQSGVAVITVRDNVTGKTAGISVSVTGSEKATSMVFAEKSVTLEVGDKYKAELIFTPQDITNHSAVFYTTDSKIVSVTNEGVMTAKGEGVCVIEAIYENDTSLVATMEVTVIDPFVIINTSGNSTDSSPESEGG